MSADVLAFTIELPDRKYASINNRSRGFRDPRKSPIYNAVFAAVKAHAEDEIDRIGWEKAECECAVTIIRIVNRRMRVDAGNLSKVELDSMTEAGVWTDDRLATPVNLQVRYDEDGVNRVVIVVMKLYDPLNVRIAARGMEARKGRDAKRLDGEATTARSRRDAPENPRVDKLNNSSTSGKIKYTGGLIPEGYCVVNGYLEPAAGILEQILRPERKRAS